MEAKVELKVINLSKHIIEQMCFISLPIDQEVEILGWINLDRVIYTIVKLNECYYKTYYITKVEKQIKGYYDVRPLTPIIQKVSYWAHDFMDPFNHFPKSESIDTSKSYQQFYERIVLFKEKTDSAGQVYYN